MLMSAAQRINSWLQTHLGVFHQRAQIVHDITILDRQSLWVIPISALPTCTQSYGRLTSHVFFKRMIVLLLSAARMANSVEKFCRSRQRYILIAMSQSSVTVVISLSRMLTLDSLMKYFSKAVRRFKSVSSRIRSMTQPWIRVDRVLIVLRLSAFGLPSRINS